MPASVATATLVQSVKVGPLQLITGRISLAPGPDTYTTGGIAFNMATNANVRIRKAPKIVLISNTSGYVFRYIKGANLSSGKLMILTGAAAQSPLTELTNAAAIPAAASSDVIEFVALAGGA